MRQFVYISTAIDPDHVSISTILEQSQRNNPQRDITGFLLFNGRNFLQLVEGPDASLIALMNKLATDPRHGGITRLENLPIDRRACPDWTMQYLKLADSVAQRREKLQTSLPPSLAPEISRVVLNFAVLN